MYRKAAHSLALFAFAALLAPTAHANNISVSSPSLTGNDPFAGTVNVQFNISWANSWRGQSVNNWDAAWVFVKYRTTGNPAWKHAKLNETGHTAPAGSQIDLGLRTPGGSYNASTNPVIGVYVRRSADGTGTFTATGVQLLWNYGALGINYIDIAQVEVFGIEMVYVPQGAFWAGSGGTETNAFTLTNITTANANTTGGYPTGQTAPGSNWPNGFTAFYTMKYELSQQGYADFLNTLTYTQQATMTAYAPNGAIGLEALSNTQRSGIEIQTPGVATTTPAVYACNVNGNGIFGEATDGKDLPCNYMSWGKVAAYLDWSGLRPMSELEFEKACRGIAPPVANEYPWGTTTVASGNYTLSNAGATNEGIATNYNTSLGNAAIEITCQTIGGPPRVGVFAANAGNTGRVTAGAGYYGVMDLGGGVAERIVTIGNLSGRFYTGVHGDGTLDNNGNANEGVWPSNSTGEGAGYRGSFYGPGGDAASMRVSDRTSATTTLSGIFPRDGCRGVRSAP